MKKAPCKNNLIPHPHVEMLLNNTNYQGGKHKQKVRKRGKKSRLCISRSQCLFSSSVFCSNGFVLSRVPEFRSAAVWPLCFCLPSVPRPWRNIKRNQINNEREPSVGERTSMGSLPAPLCFNVKKKKLLLLPRPGAERLGGGGRNILSLSRAALS